jgi:hypothetical protein
LRQKQNSILSNILGPAFELKGPDPDAPPTVDPELQPDE